MMINVETEQQVRTVLHQYCHTFDNADFMAFATLFEHGRWFMVNEPGSIPVQEWITDNVVLYDDRPSPATRSATSS